MLPIQPPPNSELSLCSFFIFFYTAELEWHSNKFSHNYCSILRSVAFRIWGVGSENRLNNVIGLLPRWKGKISTILLMPSGWVQEELFHHYVTNYNTKKLLLHMLEPVWWPYAAGCSQGLERNNFFVQWRASSCIEWMERWSLLVVYMQPVSLGVDKKRSTYRSLVGVCVCVHSDSLVIHFCSSQTIKVKSLRYRLLLRTLHHFVH